MDDPILPSMQFDWDPDKAVSNEAKHGASFEEAATVFQDPLSDTYDDPDHSLEERRFNIIGTSERRRLLFVSYADDGKSCGLPARENRPQRTEVL